MNLPNLKVKRLARAKIAPRKVANIYRRLWEGGGGEGKFVPRTIQTYVLGNLTNRKAFFSVVSTDFL